MFVLRTVRVNPCSEGAFSTNNFNRQRVLSDVVISAYPTTRRHSPIIVIFSQSDVTLASLLDSLSIQRAVPTAQDTE
jgi:hypothetical protein